MNAPENPLAFPGDVRSYTDPDTVIRSEPGMSLRDWFAGQALAGYLSDPNVGGDPETMAARMYAYADAMLAARVRS